MTESKEVIKKQDAGVAPVSEMARQVFELAKDERFDPAKLDALLRMMESERTRIAEEEFSAALARFQQECPKIPKTRVNPAFEVTRAGGRKEPSKYAPLEEVVKIIREPLNNNGLSYTWDSETIDNRMIVRCTLRHIGGGSKQATFEAQIQGNRATSSMQASRSAWSYGRRTSLESVLGLVADDEDNDGAGGEKTETITLDQQEDIRQRMDRLNASDRAWQSFLGMFGVSSLADVPAHEYQRADQILAAKEGKR